MLRRLLWTGLYASLGAGATIVARRAASQIVSDRDRRGAADQEMSKVDRLVDRGADRLQELADRAAAGNGVKAKLAQPLAQDAEFLRKLKPSLIARRARGERPTDEEPDKTRVGRSGPRFDKHPLARPKDGGPNPFVIVGTALAMGVFLAKWIDRKGHGRPRG